MESQEDEDGVQAEAGALEQEGLAEDDAEVGDIHGVADEAIQAGDDQGFGGRKWGEGSSTGPDEARDGFEQGQEAEDDHGAGNDSQRIAGRGNAPTGDDGRQIDDDESGASEDRKEERHAEVGALAAWRHGFHNSELVKQAKAAAS